MIVDKMPSAGKPYGNCWWSNKGSTVSYLSILVHYFTTQKSINYQRMNLNFIVYKMVLI